jgi:4-amino-4-deoxy-L-arabinose transferase-like glycosyltransferase
MATAAAAAALPRTRAPRRLYVGLALLAIAIVVAGFWRTYFGPLLAGAVDKPSIIHVHAVIYVGWLAIFLAQALLAATGRVAAHMKLGRLATGYGVLVIGAGLLAAFGMFVLRVRAGEVADAQSRLVGPCSTCSCSRRCSRRPSTTGGSPSCTSGS